jgi:hypothetical protein
VLGFLPSLKPVPAGAESGSMRPGS